MILMRLELDIIQRLWTNSEFPYAKRINISYVIYWALYKKNPLLYLKHKKRGINLDRETNLINSTSLKFNTDAL